MEEEEGEEELREFEGDLGEGDMILWLKGKRSSWRLSKYSRILVLVTVLLTLDLALSSRNENTSLTKFSSLVGGGMLGISGSRRSCFVVSSSTFKGRTLDSSGPTMSGLFGVSSCLSSANLRIPSNSFSVSNNCSLT